MTVKCLATNIWSGKNLKATNGNRGKRDSFVADVIWQTFQRLLLRDRIFRGNNLECADVFVMQCLHQLDY